jgi:hypothetical protein
MSEEKIKELEKKIAELKNQFPAHSIPPAMMQLLDDLEDQLEEARREAQQ